MMKTPLVSISCITYNHESYIRECLDGFIMQKTDFLFEVLIHDDASTDKTADIIREYEAKYPDIIKPIYQTENQWSKRKGGINIRFNFNRAKGKYIAMCEGDDYWTDPLKLQKQVDFLEANDEYSGAASKAEIYYVNTGEKHIKENHNKDTITIKDLQKNLYFQTGTFIFRKEISKHFEYLPILSGDKYLFLLVASYGDIHMLQEVTSVYRKHPGGVSHYVTSSQILTDLIIADVIKNHSEDFLPNEYNIHILEKVFLASSVIYFSDLLKTTKVYFRITLLNKMEHTKFWYIKHYFRLLQKGVKKVKFKTKI